MCHFRFPCRAFLALTLLAASLRASQTTTFGSHKGAAAGSAPWAIATGYFNNDSFLDLVVANSGDNNVSVLLGKGDGTFQPAVNYAVGNFPQSVAVADLNHDGFQDLVVANYGSGTISVLLGNGNGTFQTAVTYTTGSSTDFVAVGNLNADNFPDLVTANYDGSDISVLINKGDGTFLPAVHYSVGNSSTASSSGPNCITLADFNGDGKLDCAVPKYFNNSVSILLGNGDGTFQAPTDYPVGSEPNITAAGDLNGDGITDLAVTNFLSGNVSLLFGNGDGTFKPAVNLSTGNQPSFVLISDINSDNIADILVANSSLNNTDNSTLGIFHGNGEGVFQPMATYTPAPEFPQVANADGAFAFCIGDFNGDKMPDVAVAYMNSNNVVVFLNSTPFLKITTTAASNATVTATTLAPQTLNLSATITGAGGTIVNEGTVTFRIFKNGVNVGTPMVSPTVSNGSAGVVYSVPPNTAPGVYSIHAGYSGSANFTASVDNSKTLTVLAPGSGGGNPPVVTDISFSRNPVRTNVNVTMTAKAVSPSGQPLSFEWFFFNNAGTQDGPSLQGNPVQRPFGVEDTFIVVVIANDGSTKSAEFKNLKVSALAPNPGAFAKSVVTSDKLATNPVDQVTLRVPDSLGGVDDLDVVDNSSTTAPGARASDTFDVSLPDQNLSFQSSALASKYTKSGIYPVVTANTDGTRKARLMLPVSGGEVGDSTTVNDLRSSTGANLKSVKGRFTFTGTDTVSISAEIELPGNLSLNQSLDFALGVSNIFGDGTLNNKGKVLNFSNPKFKRITIKRPRVDKKTGLTKGGEKMLITISLSAAGLSSAGFDTEGVSNNKLIARGQPQTRKLQFATVIGGVSYYDLLPVTFVLSDKGFGSIQGR